VARIVMVHGLGGSPRSLGEVPWNLAAQGFVVNCPTLPGHSATPGDLVGITRTQWLDAVRAAVQVDDDPVVIVGQSLGATLALHLAATSTDGQIVGVVAINPPCAPLDPDVLDHLDYLSSRGKVMSRVGPSTLCDPDAVDPSYEELPIESLLELAHESAEVFAMLTDVQCPVLLVTSAHDDVIDPTTADSVARQLGAHCQRLALANSGHVACLDLDRTTLAAGIAEFAPA
jgi:carboxylesterase